MGEGKGIDKRTGKTNILCLVSYNFLPAVMGGQKGIASFYHSFAKQVNITCVTTKSNDPKAAGYEVLNILSNAVTRYINIFYFFALRGIIKQKEITHLQIEHPYYGWLALLVKWFCGVKLILHSHNIEGLRFKSTGKWWWRILLAYERTIHRNADYIFFVTDEDKAYSVNNFNTAPAKCLTTPYGIDWQKPPLKEDILSAKNKLRSLYKIDETQVILLFNGAFNYSPNVNALRLLLEKINPVLAGMQNFQYKILICGKDIPADILNNEYPNVSIAGFVDDISLYFKGADIFLNPVTIGGGIKTKVVEALGYDLSVISSRDGAIGIPMGILNNKLSVVNDGDIQQFATATVTMAGEERHIPPAYYDYFYWPNITKKAADFIK